MTMASFRAIWLALVASAALAANATHSTDALLGRLGVLERLENMEARVKELEAQLAIASPAADPIPPNTLRLMTEVSECQPG